MYTEVEILDQKDFRDELLENIEVLDKVKKIITLPETDYTTLKKVAEYYEVGEKAIHSLVSRHSDELFQNGMKLIKRSDLATFLSSSKWRLQKKNNAITTASFDNIDMFNVNNFGLYMFNRRAILNVGMLLRDSKIAQAVRKELLNIAEYNNHSEETVTRTYKRSEILLCDITLANTTEARAIALNKYKTYMEEKIKEAQEKYNQSQRKIKEQNDEIAKLKKYEMLNIENQRIIEEKDKELALLNKSKDIYIANSDNILFRNFALKLGIPLADFKQYLYDKKYCYKDKKIDKPIPYALYVNKDIRKSYFAVNSHLRNGKAYKYTCLTPNGEIFFMSIKDKIIEYSKQLKIKEKQEKDKKDGIEQMTLI